MMTSVNKSIRFKTRKFLRQSTFFFWLHRIYLIYLMKDLKFVECYETFQRHLINFSTNVWYSNFRGMEFWLSYCWSCKFLWHSENRCQQSPWKDVTADVPQGSLLGPLIFQIFPNDLSEYLKSNPKRCSDMLSFITAHKMKFCIKDFFSKRD